MARKRDSRYADAELDSVLAYLRRYAVLLDEAGVGVAGIRDAPTTITMPLVAKMQAEAEALRAVADRLERREHRA